MYLFPSMTREIRFKYYDEIYLYVAIYLSSGSLKEDSKKETSLKLCKKVVKFIITFIFILSYSFHWCGKLFLVIIEAFPELLLSLVFFIDVETADEVNMQMFDFLFFRTAEEQKVVLPYLGTNNFSPVID
jgi:heme/copper-type cytochrome/quinol oxidase subunit 4